MKRQRFLSELRVLIKEYGSDNIVYFDESGFEKEVKRGHGWALKGKNLHQMKYRLRMYLRAIINANYYNFQRPLKDLTYKQPLCRFFYRKFKTLLSNYYTEKLYFFLIMKRVY